MCLEEKIVTLLSKRYLAITVAALAISETYQDDVVSDGSLKTWIEQLRKIAEGD